jgi:hypothetical protein
LRKGFLGKEGGKSVPERRGGLEELGWGERETDKEGGSLVQSGSKVDGRGLGAGAEGER